MSATPEKAGCLLAIPELLARLFRGKPAGQRAGAGTQHMKGNLLTPRNIIIAVLAILYAVWPVDFLPDLMPIVGWLDDIGVLGIAVALIASAAHRRADNLPNDEAPQERPMRNCTPPSQDAEEKRLP